MTVIGNGTIAKAIIDKKDKIFFASGVSNSQENRESEYQKEIDLLEKQNKNKHIVYFSTLSVYFTNSRYTQHKRFIEEYIKNNFRHYTIVRLGNTTWAGNRKHLVNFFRNKITNNEPFEIRDEYRYILDKEEFRHWLNLIPKWNCEMNVTGRRMKVKDIVKEIKEGLI